MCITLKQQVQDSRLLISGDTVFLTVDEGKKTQSFEIVEKGYWFWRF